MSKIAIIPARSGSKRIKNKNIKHFSGKPIIAYSIEIALQCGLFDEVMVSTDNKEIAAISIKYGAKVPFLRSEKNSDDYATTSDVIFEVLESYEKLGKYFDYACCIYATAPLLSSQKLVDANSLIQKDTTDCVFPVVKTDFPIQRSLKIDEKQNASMFYPEHRNSRSQDLEAAYYDAGQFYFLRLSEFKNSKTLWPIKTKTIILKSSEAQDIDNEADWQLAELKYKVLNKQ